MTDDFTRTVRRMVAENDVPRQRGGHDGGVATMTLTDFLLARIAEDEARADEVHNTLDDDMLDLRAFGTCTCREPARIRAECEAKRRIVELHHRGHECPMPEYQQGLAGWYDEVAPCPTLRTLAAAYSEHPDYREEWRP